MVQKNAEFYTDFETVEKKCKKFANKKVIAKISVKNLSFSCSILLTCNSVWQRTFSG